MDFSKADLEENDQFFRLQAKYTAIKKRNILLQKRVEELEVQNNGQSEDIKRLEKSSNQGKELQRQNKVLRQNLAAAEKRAKRAEKANAQMDERVAQMEASYRERLKEIQMLLTKLEDVNGVVRELHAAREDHDQKIQKMDERYVVVAMFLR